MRKLFILFTLLLAVPLGMLAQGASWQEATQLPLGQEKSGALSNDRKEEWWKFTVTQDGAANIYVAPGSGLRINEVRLYYCSFNDDNQITDYWSRSSTTFYFNPGWNAGSMDVKTLAPGTYLFKVTRGEGTGSYTVKCTFTANEYTNDKVGDDWNNSSILPLETPKQGHLGYGYTGSDEDNADWWTFTVKEDGAVTIGIAHEGTLRISEVRLHYYSYNDNDEIANYWSRSSTNYYFNPGWNAGSMVVNNLKPGDYLIKVTRGEGQGGYELTCNFTPCSYAYDKEPDDVNQTKTLPLNTPKQGHLGYGYAGSDEDNVDWWAFEVKQDGKANIGITHDGSMRISEVRLHYYEYKNGEIVNYWSRSSTTYWFNPGWNPGSMDVPNLAPGLYLIKVTRGEGQGGYELTCNFTPQEYKNDNEPNNNWDTGLANNYLARGQEKQGHLGYGYANSNEDDYDYYRFKVVRDGKVNLIYTPSNVNSSLRVNDVRVYYIEYDKENKPINWWQRSSNAYYINPGWNSGTLSIPNMAPGEYLVHVQRGEGYGAYSLKYDFEQNELPNDAEPNNQWAQAAQLPVGKTLSGHLGYGYANGNEDDYDWYQVELAAKGDLTINVQPGNGLRISDVRLYTYEYNAAGEPINVWQRSQSTYYFNPGWNFGTMTTKDVEAGKYAIRVQRGEGQGNYRIAVNAALTDVEPVEPLGNEKVDEDGEDSGLCFIVWLSETEKHVYPLSEKPMVTMANGQFTLTTMNTTVTYAHDDVLKYTLGLADGSIPIEDIYFIVWLSDPEKHIYALSEKPMVTMANGKFTITTMNTTATYNHDQVMKFTLGLEDGTSSIEMPAFAESKPTMERHADRVIISGSKPNSPIHIYNVGGRLMASHKTDGNGNAQVMIADLPAGVYVVKTESITIKIAKR